MTNRDRARVYMRRSAEQFAVAKAMSARAQNAALPQPTRIIADAACRAAVARAFRLEEIAFEILAFDGSPLAASAGGR